MIKKAFICDKCGIKEETEEYTTIKSWTELKFQISSSDYGNKYITKNFCPKCSVALGMSFNNYMPKSEQSRGERLVEILTEIAKGETNE